MPVATARFACGSEENAPVLELGLAGCREFGDGPLFAVWFGTIAEVGARRKSCADIWIRIYATVKYDHADTAGGSLFGVSS
jgi:hypothetical protein